MYQSEKDSEPIADDKKTCGAIGFLCFLEEQVIIYIYIKENLIVKKKDRFDWME